MKIDTKYSVITFLRGMVMGIAEVIPGVSGSTMALIMGIYDTFIGFLAQISDFVKEIIKLVLMKSTFSDIKKKFFDINFKFGVFLAIGMVFAFGLFAHVISYFIEVYPVYIFAFFFGLVLASLPIPYKEMKNRGIKELVIFLLTFGVIFYLLGASPPTTVTDPSFLLMFVGGFFAISSMLLPGISGSFILLLMGLYGYVIEVVKNATQLKASTEDLLKIMTLGLGIIVGFLVVSKILKFLLKNYNSYLMAFLIGLMMASLRVLWPLNYADEMIVTQNTDVIAIVVGLVGFLIVFLLQRTSVKKEIKKAEKEVEAIEKDIKEKI